MDRFGFEKILSSITIPDGTPTSEINRLLLPVSKAIIEMMPKSLFRYRNCDETSIDAFEKDMIYAVPADWFNDPYDTLVSYDFEGIDKLVDTVVSPEWLEQLKSFYGAGNDIPAEYKVLFPEAFWERIKNTILEIPNFQYFDERLKESRRQMISLVSSYFPIISVIGKRFSTIACFSEDERSVLMWSHYADSHKGFALEYDFRSTHNQPIPRVILLPVIYSEKRFDASSFLAWALLQILGNKANNPDITASIKAALFKSKEWEYEKEWRMIDPGPHNIINPAPTSVKYRPVAIYYGHRIAEKNKARLHTIAAGKGIREYEMVIDYSSSRYEMHYRKFSST